MDCTAMAKIGYRDSSEAFCRIGCPFFNRRRKVCSVAYQLLTPGEQYQASYCRTDDYDDCPLYLCQALRSSQSLGHNQDSIRSSGQ